MCMCLIPEWNMFKTGIAVSIIGFVILLYIIPITIGKDYFLVFEKMILGIISHSAFMWINALYSCFLGVARHFSGKTTVYHLYIAIGIAAFTFFEFGFSVKELIQVRKVNNPITKALAYINFSAICTSFVLTQIALTALKPEENHSIGNGISAIIFSTIIFITGIIMLLNRKRLVDNNY